MMRRSSARVKGRRGITLCLSAVFAGLTMPGSCNGFVFRRQHEHLASLHRNQWNDEILVISSRIRDVPGGCRTTSTGRYVTVDPQQAEQSAREDQTRTKCKVSAISLHKPTLLHSFPRDLKRAKDQRQKKKLVWSFFSFLESRSFLRTIADGDIHVLSPLETAAVAALRFCGEDNDYRRILALVKAILTLSLMTSTPLLSPYMVREAVESFAKTKGNLSKLKQLWSLLTTQPSPHLTAPLTARELNSMLTALAGRYGRPIAAMDLYHQSHIQGDEFSVSILLNALTESIEEIDPMTENDRASAAVADRPIDSEQQQHHSAASPCWQYHRGLSLLQNAPHSLNNYCFTAALKLNERAGQVFADHPTARVAIEFLDLMKQRQVSPDVVTCVTALDCLDKHYQWKTALALLGLMEKQQLQKPESVATNKNTTYWQLPPPNAHAYSAVISACARSNEMGRALSLLERMRAASEAITSSDIELSEEETDGAIDKNATFQPPPPTTWDYNAAMMGCAQASRRSHRRPLHRMAAINMTIHLLNQMEQDHARKGMDTAPDTVTYNTVLNVLDGVRRSTSSDDIVLTLKRNESHQDAEWRVYDSSRTHDGDPSSLKNGEIDSHRCDHPPSLSLLQDMKARGVPRNSLTFHNAIRAAAGTEGVIFDILDMAHNECTTTTTGPTSSVDDPSSLTGRARDGERFVHHAALAAFAHCQGSSDSNLANLARVLEIMRANKIDADAETISLIMVGVGRLDSTLLVVLLDALDGNVDAQSRLLETTAIDLRNSNKFVLTRKIYASAISECVARNDLDSALQILVKMRNVGHAPTQSTLQDVALGYAKASMRESEKVTYERRRRQRKQKTFDKEGEGGIGGDGEEERELDAAKALAQNAVTILQETIIGVPSPQVLSAACQACCHAEMFEIGRELLQQMHSTAASSSAAASDGLKWLDSKADAHPTMTILPELHRALLQMSASKGNITAAMWFAEDIQALASKLYGGVRWPSRTKPTTGTSDGDFDLIDSSIIERLAVETASDDQRQRRFSTAKRISMKGTEWKLLMMAASRAGEWKLCVNTLQFIRPYVMELHPRKAPSSSLVEDRRRKKYMELSKALTAAVQCFGLNQDSSAWSVRAVQDWIKWSGRRPPKEALLALIQSLTALGQAAQVSALLERVLKLPRSTVRIEEKIGRGRVSYERYVHIGAITALYNEGCLEEADALFTSAVDAGYLPSYIFKEERGNCFTVDLHGMNVAMAHSAVRVAMQQRVLDEEFAGREMHLVTGRGIHSTYQMRPVLRPEMQRILTEEFYPPLSTSSLPGNMGALVVPVADMEAWVRTQKQLRSSRMLQVASIIKDLSGPRLTRSVELLTKLNQENATQEKEEEEDSALSAKEKQEL